MTLTEGKFSKGGHNPPLADGSPRPPAPQGSGGIGSLIPNEKYITVFDQLSETALVFLEEKTRDQEPWCGFGFATEVHKQIVDALSRKSK